MAKGMTKVQRKQAEGLFVETIVPALGEDFEFKTVQQAQGAIDFLIEKLKNLKPHEVMFDTIEDDE